jgi:hypothetical protein
MFLNRKLFNLTFVDLEGNVGPSAILKTQRKARKSMDFIFVAVLIKLDTILIILKLLYPILLVLQFSGVYMLAIYLPDYSF